MRHAKAVRAKAQEASNKTELSNEKELPEPHANGAHGETELPDEIELPDENELRGEPYEEVDVAGQRKSLTSTPVKLLGQVST